MQLVFGIKNALTLSWWLILAPPSSSLLTTCICPFRVATPRGTEQGGTLSINRRRGKPCVHSMFFTGYSSCYNSHTEILN